MGDPNGLDLSVSPLNDKNVGKVTLIQINF